MLDLLDNITWHALSGPHARFAQGSGAARRYARGFSPILGFEDVARADFAPLQPYCAPGEEFYTDGWTGTVPRGWTLRVESTMFKMVWDGELPPREALAEAARLGAEHAAQAVALATLTHPGPFAMRTLELGDYYGVFEGPRLVAMAGERMTAGRLREISGVCTHPDFAGRGLARRLVLQLVGNQLHRGESPFLHVMHDNAIARGLYKRMGFREHCASVVRVVRRID